MRYSKTSSQQPTEAAPFWHIEGLTRLCVVYPTRVSQSIIIIVARRRWNIQDQR